MISRRTLGAALACVSLLTTTTSCTRGPGGLWGPSSTGFPSRAEVEALTHGSGAVNPFAQAVVDADAWTFAEPLAERLEYETYLDPSPWGEPLAEYAASGGGRLTPTRAMHCSARELARFYLQYSAMPAVPLRRAIFEHCGSLDDEVVPRYLFGRVDVAHTDAMLHHAWQHDVRALLHGMGEAGARDLGIAFARDDKKAVVVVLSGERKAQLEPVSRVVGSDGKLVLRGRTLVPADRLSALINQGRYGYARCTPDASARLPEFSFTCVLDPADPGARIDLAAYREGRIFGDALIGVEARRDGSATVYNRQRYTDAAIISEPSELRSRLLELVNEVRGHIDLDPVTLSAAESATSEKLAPRYFEAIVDPTKEAVAEVILVGLLAGWDVGAPIRDANFTSAAVGPTRDASEWISAVLASPGGRSALLEPTSSVVALGPVVIASPPVIGALFSCYTLFESDDHDAERAKVLAKIRTARADQGLSEPVFITTLDDDASAVAAGIHAGVSTPAEGLGALIQQSSDVLGRSVRGLVYESVDVDQLVVPPELLASKRLELSVTVTHYQPSSEPWGRFVVLLVILGEGPTA